MYATPRKSRSWRHAVRVVTLLLVTLMTVPPLPVLAAALETPLPARATPAAKDTQKMGAFKLEILLGAKTTAAADGGTGASNTSAPRPDGSVLDYLGPTPPDESVLDFLDEDAATAGELVSNPGGDEPDPFDAFDPLAGYDPYADAGDADEVDLPALSPSEATAALLGGVSEADAEDLDLPTEAPEGFSVPRAAAIRYNLALDASLTTRAFEATANYGVRWHPGADVVHEDYGDGHVVKIDEDGDTHVSFSGTLREIDPEDLLPAAGETSFDFLDQNGNTLSPHVVKGLILTRDIFVPQIRGYALGLEGLLAPLSVSQQEGLYQALLEQAHVAEEAFESAEHFQALADTYRTTAPVPSELRDDYDPDRFQALADEQRELFLTTVDKTPLLRLEKDGVPLWIALGSTNDWYLETHYGDVASGRPQHRTLLEEFVASSAAQAYAAADEAEAANSVEDLWKFGTSQFAPQHQAASMLGEAVGSELPADLIDETRTVVLASNAERDYQRAHWSVGLGALAALSLLLPGVGPFIAAGIGAVEIYRDGSELVVVYGELESAEQTAPVTGYEYVETVRQEAAATEGQFFMSLAGGFLDVLDAGYTAIRILRPAGAADEIATGVRVFDGAPPGWTASDDVWVLPNGAAAAVRGVTPGEASTLLGKLDQTAIASFPRAGVPGDADFFLSNGLQPQLTVEVGGRRFHLSTPYRGPEGKTALVAFEETAAGTLIPRTFYVSGTHGIWRAVNAADISSIHKGPFVPTDRDGNLVPLDEASSWKFFNEGSVDVAAELQGPLVRWAQQQGVRDPAPDSSQRAFFGHVETPTMPLDDPLAESYAATEFGQWVNVNSVNTPLPTTARTPDFSDGPLDQWSFDHPNYGPVDGFLFPSDDGSALFVVLRDSDGHVWVPSVQDADAGLTPFGTRYSGFDPGNLTDTPISYPGQQPRRGDAFAPPRPDGYVDAVYENPFNEQFRSNLPDEVTDVPLPTATAGATGTAGAARGATAATGIGPVRAAGGVVDVVDLTADASDVEVRITEIEQQLQQRRLPTTLTGLLEGLSVIPEEFRDGEAWEQAVRLAGYLQSYTNLLTAVSSPEIYELYTTGGKLLVTEEQWDVAQTWVTSPYRDQVGIVDEDLIDGVIDKTRLQLNGVAQTWTTEEIEYVRALLVRGEAILGWHTLTTTVNEDGTILFDGLEPVFGEEDLELLETLFYSPTPIRVGEPVPADGDANDDPDDTDAAGNTGGTASIPTDTVDFATIDAARNPFAIGGPSGHGVDSGIELVIVSTGGSTGDVFEVFAINNNPFPVRINAEDLVLEPIEDPDDETRDKVDFIKDMVSRGKAMEGIGVSPGVGFAMPHQMLNVARVALEGYCLEFDQGAPHEGTLFRIALPEEQLDRQHAGNIMRAAERLGNEGGLTPDSDLTDYRHSITQWAVWTDEKSWDARSYEEEFVDQVRDNVKAADRPWNDEVDEIVRNLVPNRWADIRAVLQAAQADRQAARFPPR